MFPFYVELPSNFESFRFTHSFVLVNLYNDCRHVVATKSFAYRDVSRAAVIEQQLHWFFHLRNRAVMAEVTLVEFLRHKIDSLLALFDIPNAIAGQENELDLTVDRFDANVGESWNSLIFSW